LDNLTYAITSPQPSPLGGEGVERSKLDKIIKLAKCEFIYDLPDGVDTEI